MEVKAREVFTDADADESGTLDRAEQVDADARAETEIQTRFKKHRNILPAVPEPKLADREAMTVDEFIQHFESLAGRMDAAVRTHQIASRRPHRDTPAPPVFGAITPAYPFYIGGFERNRDVEGDSPEGVRKFYPDNPKSEPKSPTEDVQNPSGNLSQPVSGKPSVRSHPGPKGPTNSKVSGGNKPNGGGGIDKPPPKEGRWGERPEKQVPTHMEKQDREEKRPKEREEKQHKDKDKDKDRSGRK
jgi:hypothetical protein